MLSWLVSEKKITEKGIKIKNKNIIKTFFNSKGISKSK